MKMFRVVLLSVALAATAGTASAQMGFNAARSGVQLTSADRELLAQSIRSVLGASRVGETAAWQNPETGLSGETRLVEAYTADGAPCGRVDLRIRRRDQVAPFDLHFCRRPDGWALAG